MAYFPLFADLSGRACLVVGGGPVAERKVDGLLAAGAVVTVVSPRLTRRLARAVARARVRHLRRRYRRGDVAGATLAFAATGDPRVDGAVAAEGRRRGVWVNVADVPARCDFILPSILRRGALTVAVSTGGASPAVARAVREQLERSLTPAHGALVEIAGEVRRVLRARGRRPGAARWRGALPEARRLLAGGRRDEARRRLARRLGLAS
ncbi:MAG: bifunctional precorrin-2 dehydrogenase/sirohydrochlorin ferrochelatase [Candidatus Rokubacteria bacterium]|nr:bifunctional precorrin-2 dehydrogenase/sirohydrochlorin ferrochelatase [Candidatus Rokubacteria bacterium]